MNQIFSLKVEGHAYARTCTTCSCCSETLIIQSKLTVTYFIQGNDPIAAIRRLNLPISMKAYVVGSAVLVGGKQIGGKQAVLSTCERSRMHMQLVPF